MPDPELESNSPQEHPAPTFRETWPSWLWIMTVLAVGVGVGIGVIYLMRPLARPLAIFIIGVTVASALSPAVSWLEKRMRRGLGITVVYILFILAVLGIGRLVIPLLVSQAGDLIKRTPNLINQLDTWLSTTQLPVDTKSIGASLGAFGTAILSLPVMFINSLLDLFLIFFISLYWLILNPQLKEFILSLFPATQHEHAMQILRQMGQGMGGYLRASAINGVIIGILTYIGLVIIGVNFPAVLALVMGLMEIIPALGPVIGGAFIVLVAFLQAPQLALISLIFVIALQQAEGHILVPNIMRTQTEISPLLVIMALVGGAAVGGLLGALVAIPAVAALKVLVDEFVAPAIRRRTGALPADVPEQ